tara:strand:+ start:2898 stop:3845 length:948 start_codon:yes stop_codon:yes gene_type:complete
MPNKHTVEEADKIMRACEYIPLEPYSGDSQIPLHVKCARCGEPRYATLGNAQRAAKKHQNRRCCLGSKTLLIKEQQYKNCIVKGCSFKQRTQTDDHCRGHAKRLDKYGDTYPDVPLVQSLPRNSTCMVPIDSKGTPCGRVTDKGYVGLKDPSKFDPKSIEYGEICQGHGARWYKNKTFEAGRKLRPTLFHLDWTETIAFYLDPQNGYVKPNNNGCLVWQHTKMESGYGSICIAKDGEGLTRIATHRKVWEVANNETIPEGNQIHHICGERACVNIDHLESISYKENNAEACRVKALREEVAELKAEIRRLKRKAA